MVYEMKHIYEIKLVYEMKQTYSKFYLNKFQRYCRLIIM